MAVMFRSGHDVCHQSRCNTRAAHSVSIGLRSLRVSLGWRATNQTLFVYTTIKYDKRGCNYLGTLKKTVILTWLRAAVCVVYVVRMKQNSHLLVACSIAARHDILTQNHPEAPPLYDMPSATLEAIRTTALPIMEE